MLKIKFKRLSEYAKKPHKANPTDAAFDLHMAGWKKHYKDKEVNRENVTLQPNQQVLVLTDLAIQPELGYMVKLMIRSSLALKKELIITNSPGIGDPSYKNNYGLIIKSLNNKPVTLAMGERVAQCTIEKIEDVMWVEVAELDDNDDRGGGFGSSGKM